MKFGFFFSPYQNNTQYDFYGNGNFSFYGPSTSVGSGTDLADFLFGLPDNYYQAANALNDIRYAPNRVLRARRVSPHKPVDPQYRHSLRIRRAEIRHPGKIVQLYPRRSKPALCQCAPGYSLSGRSRARPRAPTSPTRTIGRPASVSPGTSLATPRPRCAGALESSMTSSKVKTICNSMAPRRSTTSPVFTSTLRRDGDRSHGLSFQSVRHQQHRHAERRSRPRLPAPRQALPVRAVRYHGRSLPGGSASSHAVCLPVQPQHPAAAAGRHGSGDWLRRL